MAEEELNEALARRRIFYLNDENRDNQLQTIRDRADALQREVEALDVFIETINANPKSF